MRILVLGGYGLIGTALTKTLLSDGHDVVGLGRSARKGKALIPTANWFEADISKLLQLKDWGEFLYDIDVVVNASGALQNGLSDNLVALQKDAIISLIKACEINNIKHFIQISAPDANINSSTLFYQSKAAADNALKASALAWTIFRPGLVISPQAYGGTSLIRMLAAFPYIQPIMLANNPVQTVSIDQVAQAVSFAINHNITGVDTDLVEDEPHRLADLTLMVRHWLGFGEPKAVIEAPFWLGRAIARMADVMGWLGWRSALRTTSLRVLKEGVRGTSDKWQALSGASIMPLSDTLSQLPSTKQERIYARTMLAFPLMLGTLALFWIISGVIGFVQYTEAVDELKGSLSKPLAKIFVFIGSSADIFIGAGLLFRSLTRMACLASIVLSLAYLTASAYFTPHLWADPLGPMVKVFPAMALAVIVAALMEER